MQDKPSQDVIEDDVELDRWHEQYMRKLAVASGNPTALGGGSASPSQTYEE